MDEDYPPRASRRRPWRPSGRSFSPLAGTDEALAWVSAESIAPTLNSMPAAANVTSAVPARSRQVVSCGLDRGFLAAGGVGWVAGQAAGSIAPLEKPVAGADAAWAMDGRGMDTTGEAPPLQPTQQAKRPQLFWQTAGSGRCSTETPSLAAVRGAFGPHRPAWPPVARRRAPIAPRWPAAAPRRKWPPVLIRCGRLIPRLRVRAADLGTSMQV